MLPLNSNSTILPLVNAGTFTGEWFDVTKERYSNIVVVCFSDKSGLLYIDLSVDGSTAVETHSFSVSASVTTKEIEPLSARYVRVRFNNNSGQNQLSLQLGASLIESRPTSIQAVDIESVVIPDGISTSANQTNGSQRTMIVNGDNTPVSTKPLNVQVVTTDEGLITHSVIHGLTTAGGGSFVDVKVNPSGALTVASQEDRPSAATVTSISSSASSVQILASNGSRIMAIFFNDSSATLFLKFGSTASSTSFTVKILAGGYFECPFPCYTGRIDGIWESANGSVRITEM